MSGNVLKFCLDNLEMSKTGKTYLPSLGNHDLLHDTIKRCNQKAVLFSKLSWQVDDSIETYTDLNHNTLSLLR